MAFENGRVMNVVAVCGGDIMEDLRMNQCCLLPLHPFPCYTGRPSPFTMDGDKHTSDHVISSVPSLLTTAIQPVPSVVGGGGAKTGDKQEGGQRKTQ
ncbi:hypothetical protein E2C01_066010 [Portunus trituberculatus]|uniref:Uncharacterized protein n=1 Tax=Portunus trituberculatus TaxID=210409 RepID=A0A5B7HTD9_PORTR|nr:hypothetical protein [Portunus trituberculatus]